MKKTRAELLRQTKTVEDKIIRTVEDKIIRIVGQPFFDRWLDQCDLPDDAIRYLGGISFIYHDLMAMQPQQLEDKKAVLLPFLFVMANFRQAHQEKA